MKRLTIFFIALIVSFTACNIFIVEKYDPSVLDSSIELSDEIADYVHPDAKTLSMRARGQADNFLLIDIYGMESFSNTRSVEVLDSLAGNELFWELIEDGTGMERGYRTLQFRAGPFEKDQTYTLHLSESRHALSHDELSLSFNYTQTLDRIVRANSYYYLLSEMRIWWVSARSYQISDIPDFNYVDYLDDIDTIRFFKTDYRLLIRSILSLDCDVTHSVDHSIVGDTLIMQVNLGPSGTSGCNKWVFCDYLIEDYMQQSFFYQLYLTNSNRVMLEGFYENPRIIIPEFSE
ncbi:MAG: hypothetical protein KAU44_05145 [Candidatus Marinimicrobia bacterium]|nr:hypothetical protein [Candidatus Neomarinimicrobiota bacterium]